MIATLRHPTEDRRTPDTLRFCGGKVFDDPEDRDYDPAENPEQFDEVSLDAFIDEILTGRKSSKRERPLTPRFLAASTVARHKGGLA